MKDEKTQKVIYKTSKQQIFLIFEIAIIGEKFGYMVKKIIVPVKDMR